MMPRGKKPGLRLSQKTSCYGHRSHQVWEGGTEVLTVNNRTKSKGRRSAK